VDGVRYVPLLKAEGYREEGLASWYGAEEHGGPTSNGEVFDMYRPTAAHKTLPLGCIIRVTNRANGKETLARINDRGPFIPGRIVDLSYRGALDLGLVDRGVAPVILEVVSGGAGSGERAYSRDRSALYAVQVASFGDRGPADSLAERLRREQGQASVREGKTQGGTVFRVRAGRYRSRTEAEAARASLSRSGYPDAFVVEEKE
jgi:rare lipoprotein A